LLLHVKGGIKVASGHLHRVIGHLAEGQSDFAANQACRQDKKEYDDQRTINNCHQNPGCFAVLLGHRPG
jgi:hypothetical protein